MITIALLTYNRPQYLKIAINAILNQSYQEFELIVFDNGSEIETTHLISSLKDRRIKVVRNHVNSREFVNEIFDFINSKYFIITHDDDIMAKGFLSNMLDLIEKENFDFLGCSVEHINELGEKLDFFGQDDKSLKILRGDPINNYFDYNYPSLPTVVMRASFVKKYQLKFNFSVGPAADAYFWYQALKFGAKIGVYNSVLFSYRIHSNQDSVINKWTMELILFEKWLTEKNCDNQSTLKIFDRCYLYFQLSLRERDFQKKHKIRNFISSIDPKSLSFKRKLIIFSIINENPIFLLLYKLRYIAMRLLRSKLIYIG